MVAGIGGFLKFDVSFQGGEKILKIYLMGKNTLTKSQPSLKTKQNLQPPKQTLTNTGVST